MTEPTKEDKEPVGFMWNDCVLGAIVSPLAAQEK